MSKPVRLVFLADDSQLRKALSTLVGQTAATQAWLNKLQKTGADMQRIGRTMSLGITVPVLGAAAAAEFFGAKFESTMTTVQTLAGASAQQVKEWGDQILKMAPGLAKSPQELAEALYFIVSSGAKASDALGILTASAKASTAGLGDTKTIADAVTSALNAYGSENLSAAHATDILLRAVKDGKGEASALAQSIGLVIPIAAQVGVGFEQVAGGMAALTQTGSSAAEASTQLRNIFTEILHPSHAVQGELQKLGLSAADLQAELKQKGLLATLQDLQKRVGGNEAAFSKLFPNVRGLLGALSLVGPNGAKAAAVLQDVAAAGGDVDRAFDTASQTRLFQWKDALATLQVVAIKLGNDIAPAVGKFTDMLSGTLGVFERLSPSTRSLIETILALAAAMGPLLYVTGSMVKTFASLAKHPVITMLALLVVGFVTAYTHSAKFRDTVNSIAHALMEAGHWIKDNQTWLMSLGGALASFLAVSRGATLISNTAKFMQLFGVSAGTAFRAIVPLGGMFSKMVGGIRMAWMALNTTFLASPIGIVIALIVALIVAIVILWTRSSTFRRIVEETWKAIVNAVKVAVKAIVSFFEGIWNFLKDHWKLIVSIVGGPIGALIVLVISHFTQIKNFFVSVWNGIVAVVMGAVHVIVAIVKTVVAIFVAIATAIWTVVGPVFKAFAYIVMWACKVVWAIISGLVRLILAFVLPMLRLMWMGWQIIWNAIVGVVRQVWAALKPILEAIVQTISFYWNGAMAIIKAVISAIWSTIVGVFNGVVTFLTTLWSGITSTISFYWHGMLTVITTIISAISSTISGVFNGVKSFVTSIWGSISSFIGGIWGGITSAVKRGAQNVYDGIMGIWSKISGAVSGAFSGIAGGVRGAINSVIDLVNRIHIPPIKVGGVTVFDGWSGFGIPHLANGGMVTSPTLALIGEAGDELVLPLTRKARAMELLEQSGLLGKPGPRGGGGGGGSSSGGASAGGKTVTVNIGTLVTQAKTTTEIGKDIAWEARAAAL